MNFGQYFKPAPKIRPILNMGCLLDVPTGRIVRGKRGESILNGGLPFVTGIVGKGNTFKSVFGNFFMLQALNRYASAKAVEYDTEASATLARVLQLAMRMEHLAGVDLEKEGRLFLTDNTVMAGDEFFDQLKDMCSEHIKTVKKHQRTLPFLDEEGKEIVLPSPIVNFIDSFSMFSTSKVQKIYDDNRLGDGAANTDALRSAGHKTQMLMQVPTLTGQSSLFLLMTAHVGKRHQLDMYAPPDDKLAFLKHNAIKNVPEKFTFLTNNLWYVYRSSLLVNRGTKAPEYPRDSSDNMEGDTDMMVITVQNLRGKNGPTGLPFDIVLSQREGFLVGLTEFHYLRTNGRYGITGSDRHYVVDLAPDISLSRTTVRRAIDDSYRLQRAMQVQSEMLQMQQIWDDPEGVFCTPMELRDDLTAMGYNVDELLESTRGYWVFEEDEKGLRPFLSTMDLMRMRKGLYVPYFFTKEQKAAIKAPVQAEQKKE